MKAIMYHYVRPFDERYPNFKNLNFTDFRKQLDYFQEEFGFVEKEEFLNCFKNKTLPKGVVLTFDDGTNCHYDHVFQELKERKLWGIFYIPTLPFTHNKILDVHRTHILLGRVDSKTVYNFLKKIINQSMLDSTKMEEFEALSYKSQENDEYTLLVKRMMNYFVDYKFREDVMDRLMKEFIPDEDELRTSYYLRCEQIKEMQEEGMIIGSHTVNHPVMSRLSLKEQTFEIEESFSFLEQATDGLEHRTFCYPYGGFHSFDDNTELLLKKNRCEYSFNVEQRDVALKDIIERPQALPRYDCNQFRYGQVRKQPA